MGQENEQTQCPAEVLMADKAAIELGQRLNRLMANEDFAPLLAEWDGRISSLKAHGEASASVYASEPHITSHIAQRLHELASLREWIEDEIERGARCIEQKNREDLLASEAVERKIAQDLAETAP